MSTKRVRRRPVGRPSAETALELEAALLQVAASLFHEKGFARTSMKEIAERASASRQSLYARFPNKTVLFEALMKRRTEELLSAVSGIFEGDGAPDSILRAFGAQVTKTFTNSDLQRLHQVVISEALTFPELAKTFYEYGPGRGRKILMRYLSEAVGRGELSIPNIEWAAEQLMGSLVGPIIFRATLGLDPFLASNKQIIGWVDVAVTAFIDAYAVTGNARKRT